MTPIADRRIVSIWLPQLAMDLWHRRRPGDASPDQSTGAQPLVLARDGTHGPVVHAANAAALALSVRPGHRVVDAQATHPTLTVREATPSGDLALLERLVFWARRWCPWTVRDGADGLLLDVTGATHLAGGEAALLRDIRRRLDRLGLTCRTAAAPTAGAAWALARYGNDADRCHAGELADRLAPLPSTALRLDGDTLRLLDRLGLKTVGALTAVPRETLMRRFGALPADANPLIRLDRVLGRLAEPLAAPPDAIHFRVGRRVAEPVMDPLPLLPELSEQLCGQLKQAGLGARRVRLTLHRVDGERAAVILETARPTVDPRHMERLFDQQLENIDPGFGLDLVELDASWTQPLASAAVTLDGEADVDADLSGLIDRLSARLGRTRVLWSGWCESHLPEQVERTHPALTAAPLAPPPIAAERPLRLLVRPEEVEVVYAVPDGPPARFRWRRIDHRARRHTGPERIAPEWWRQPSGTRLRDYYKVEVEDGRRFWLFREGVLGDGRGGDPRWFIHGFFA